MSPSQKRAGLKNGAPAPRGSIRNSIEGVDGLDGLVIFLLHKGTLLGGTVKAPRAEDLRQGHCRGREVAEAEVEADPFQGVRRKKRILDVLPGHGIGQLLKTGVLQEHPGKAPDHIGFIKAPEHVLLMRAHGRVAFFDRHVGDPFLSNGL